MEDVITSRKFDEEVHDDVVGDTVPDQRRKDTGALHPRHVVLWETAIAWVFRRRDTLGEMENTTKTPSGTLSPTLTRRPSPEPHPPAASLHGREGRLRGKNTPREDDGEVDRVNS